jgi:predicted nuclease of predicted toxin-antitoxin system
MNLSPKWAAVLQQTGFDAVHWSNVGAATDGDPQIMNYAATHGYVVLTSDLDFGSILAATGGHGPSVIQLRTEDARVEMIGALVIKAINQAIDQLNKGALLTIETDRLRIASLPIGATR